MSIFTTAIHWLIEVMKWTIFIRVIISWFPISRENPLIKALYAVTEPILSPIRKLIAKSSFGNNMMFDFSPIIAFLILSLVGRMII
ncbi:MAG: YggT family protein [Eubacteriales bacterium]|nr:YggT family protein [Eubacteriales bacterium]